MRRGTPLILVLTTGCPTRSTAPPPRGWAERRGRRPRTAPSRGCVGVTPTPGATCRNRTASAPASSATTSRPPGRSSVTSPRPSGSPSAAARRRSGPESAAPSSAHTGTDVSITAIVIASSSALRLLKPPFFIRSSASASTGTRSLVGVEPDVAEEHAVGVRDRLPAQRDRLRAAEAVREQPQPVAQLGRARARRRRERPRRPAAGPATRPPAPPSTSPSSGRPGSLRSPQRLDPPPQRRAVEHARATSPRTLPPLKANVIVGQIATA